MALYCCKCFQPAAHGSNMCAKCEKTTPGVEQIAIRPAKVRRAA